jgi:hypothetical protein
MTIWLALLGVMLSLTTANAQCVEFPAADGRPVRLCHDNTRPRECDLYGCYFDELKKWRAGDPQQIELQIELQRRADELRARAEEEARKKRENSN